MWCSGKALELRLIGRGPRGFGKLLGQRLPKPRGRGFNFHKDKAAYQPRASCSHLCASVTKQYNLVLVEGRRRSLFGWEGDRTPGGK